jgi:hypothetical protein
MYTPTSPEPTISDINTVPKKYATIHNLIFNILETHINLNCDDIQYTSSIVCNMDMMESQLAKFLLHTYKLCNTGRFALTFNSNLDIYIKNREIESIQLLANMAERDAFIELYENPLLGQEDRNVIYDMYKREYMSMLNTIEYAISTGKSFDFLYPKCYEGIVSYETSDVTGGYQIPTLSYISEIDIQDNNRLNKVYCFDLMELIETMAEGNRINKFTGKSFNPRVYDLINQKYSKEINMYKKYLSMYTS